MKNYYSNMVKNSYNPDSTVATEGLQRNGQIYQISHQYDDGKRKTQTVYPNGEVLEQDFTDRNQLAGLTYGNQSVALFNYDLGRRETSRLLGNGLIQNTSYQMDRQIAQKKVDGITDYAYTYDANKRKTTETDSTMSDLNQTFSYDSENEAIDGVSFAYRFSDEPEGQVQGCKQQDRLTAWTSAGNILNANQTWNLSLEGSWNSNTTNGLTENRTFNAAYEVYLNNPMLHDRKGNLTQNKDGSQYTWDTDNQLSYAINANNEGVSYTYDALGRRISKDYQDKLTVFVCAGYQVLTEMVSDNGAPFTEKQSFVYGAYIDDIICTINANGRFYSHSNRQFSVGAITNSSGQLEAKYGYNAYGELVELISSPNVATTYTFTGRRLDTETGLMYFRARYYDAKLGQFISRDPIGYADGASLYRGYFAANGVDPSGLFIDGISDIVALSSVLEKIIVIIQGLRNQGLSESEFEEAFRDSIRDQIEDEESANEEAEDNIDDLNEVIEITIKKRLRGSVSRELKEEVINDARTQIENLESQINRRIRRIAVLRMFIASNENTSEDLGVNDFEGLDEDFGFNNFEVLVEVEGC